MPRKPSNRRPSRSVAVRPKREHHRFDRTLKLIAERAPAELLAWLVEVLGLPPTKMVQSNRSKELAGSEQAVDILWLIEAEGERELLHLEFELKDQRPKMGPRLVVYDLQLYEREKVPVHSIALYLRRKKTVSLPPFVIGTKRHEYLRYNYDAIKLWEVPPETVLTRPMPALWPLAGMMAQMSPARVLKVAEQIVAAVPEGAEQKELVGMLIVLAGVQFTDAALATALRSNPMIDEIWEESSTAQAMRERGQAEGELKAARRLAQQALARRFGSLDQRLLASLDEADTATLEEIVLDSSLTLAQVHARLKLPKL